MGTLFRYVADEATRPVEWASACNICERREEPIYLYHGWWKPKNRADEEEVEALCRTCILNEELRWYSEDHFGEVFGAPHDRVSTNGTDIDWPEGQDFIVRNGLRISRYRLVPRWEGPAAELIQKLRRTPQSPTYLQWSDWVVCCGDLCEFLGSPGSFQELVRVTRGATFWNHGIADQRRDFEEDGPPEGLEEISLFRCLACGRRYWIDQFT